MKDNFYIFCYLDILGYKDLVNSYADDDEAVTKLEEFLNISIFYMYDGFRNIRTGIKGDLETKAILDSIKISLISDSILIRMPVSVGTNIDSKRDSTIAIQACLYFVSFLILTFITNIGLFLRGGISIGQHYEKVLKHDSMFIFSKSLIRAYQLEQKASSIRILIDSILINFLADNNKDFTLEQHKENFYLDVDGELCLDYYDILHCEGMINTFLERVLEVVALNVARNKDNQRVLSKYETFEKYHNDKVLKKFKLPEYTSEIKVIV